MAKYVVSQILLIAVSICVFNNIKAQSRRQKNLQSSYQSLFTSPSSGSTVQAPAPARGSTNNNNGFITVNVAQLARDPIPSKQLEANLVAKKPPVAAVPVASGGSTISSRPSVNTTPTKKNACAVGDVYYSFNPNCQRKIEELQDILFAEPNAAAVIKKARALKDDKTYHPKAWFAALTTVSMMREDMRGLTKPFPEDVLPV